jgi:quercetin dioxygenase-like cupin family protein
MNRFLHSLPQAFVLFAAIVCLTQTIRAQDPVKVDPEHYKVLKETPTVRILEYKDAPGHKVPKHSHPNYFVYVITDATRLFTTNCIAPGATVKLTAGEPISKPAVTHCEENTGNTDTHLLVVEFKNASKKVGSSSSTKRHHGPSPARRFHHQVTID